MSLAGKQTYGPELFVVREFARAAIGAVAAGVPGQVGPYVFRFPRALFITGASVSPGGGSAAELAGFELRIQDESTDDMLYNWRGEHSANVLAMQGRSTLAGGPGPFFDDGIGWLNLQRPVMTGDEWRFTLLNYSVTPRTIGGLYLAFIDGITP